MIVYKYDTQTKEYIEDLKINEAYGTNLLFTTTIKPLAKKDGFAVCFNGAKWEYVEDFRNTVVYSKETKQESKISYLGKIKDDITTLKPEQFDKWDYKTNSWVCDEVEKEKARVKNINSYTQSFIYSKYPQPKQSSANLGVYDEAYKNEMVAFIRRIVDLSNKAIENNTSFEDFKAMLNE
ncbi:hypothetical protein QUR76_06970 [Arcobacter cryaerophilus gv. pseudocryaerophilus]|uniref:Uncharacterized protein n=3 Tax=unclassified Arcobacter TaxID=2593671 RepID=A0AA96DNN5_9BACT|nr:hypothetical protein RMQ65_01125 [Arcobacter sp. AZ-2023]WPD04868.1 hypothetical protein QUR76_06970 [Arcobacter sp. DSM 115956]WPD06963.1 hypothetical protein QUR78_06970 [Arcobacter sp. DSM 115955]WNL31228.1 hypothetical protein RMQ67_06970 [Arcobacter sp. AZ-2023]WNP37378.1 hypothetical protein RJG58_06970 [Arcobacter sp. AZ-2023]